MRMYVVSVKQPGIDAPTRAPEKEKFETSGKPYAPLRSVTTDRRRCRQGSGADEGSA